MPKLTSCDHQWSTNQCIPAIGQSVITRNWPISYHHQLTNQWSPTIDQSVISRSLYAWFLHTAPDLAPVRYCVHCSFGITSLPLLTCVFSPSINSIKLTNMLLSIKEWILTWVRRNCTVVTSDVRMESSDVTMESVTCSTAPSEEPPTSKVNRLLLEFMHKT